MGDADNGETVPVSGKAGIWEISTHFFTFFCEPKTALTIVSLFFCFFFLKSQKHICCISFLCSNPSKTKQHIV